MKKSVETICYLVTFFAFFFFRTSVFALEENEYILSNQGNYQNVQENNYDLIIRRESLYDFSEKINSMSSTRGVITDTRSGWLDGYPNYLQELGYYCGPATIKQAIQYINGNSLTQKTYATRMGTTSSSGTYVYKMRDELNYRQNKFSYVYQYINSGQSSIVWNAIVQNVWNNKPTILHAKTQSLYLYNGASLGHYITAIGYMGLDFENADKSIKYVDTYSRNYGRGTTLGQHWDTMINVTSSVYNRYLIY